MHKFFLLTVFAAIGSVCLDCGASALPTTPATTATQAARTEQPYEPATVLPAKLPAATLKVKPLKPGLFAKPHGALGKPHGALGKPHGALGKPQGALSRPHHQGVKQAARPSAQLRKHVDEQPI